jgi:hypothetical protein
MPNNLRHTLYDIPTNVFAHVDTGVTGAPILASRPIAQNPKYLAVMTDTGELRVYNRDGTLKYSVTVPGAPHEELKINNYGECLVKKARSLPNLNDNNIIYFISSTGVVLWNLTIANCTSIALSDNYVHAIINTLSQTSSGVQWRSKTDGFLIQDVYGLGDTIFYPVLKGVATQDGLRVYMIYIKSTTLIRMDRHDLGVGRIWTALLGASAATKSSVFRCDYMTGAYDGSYVIAHLRRSNMGSGDYVYIYLLAQDGTIIQNIYTGNVAASRSGATISPTGKLGVYWNETTLSIFRTAPYATISVTLPSRGSYADYADDDNWWAISCENGFVYIFKSHGGQIASYDINLADSPIALVRNYAE